MYQPSGISTSFGVRRHSFSIIVYTRPRNDGPARTGSVSRISTARPQPLAHPSTSARKPPIVAIRINRHGAALDALLQPRKQRKGDLGDDSFEHLT
jgi:hypothetical protein